MDTFYKNFYFPRLVFSAFLIFFLVGSCFAKTVEQKDVFSVRTTMPHSRYSSLTLCGDIFSATLPALGSIASCHYYSSPDDWEAHLTFLKIGMTSLQVSRLKKFFRKTHLGQRPNGYHSSFPSEHSAMAFIGAKIIHRHFGLMYGAGAYCLAGIAAYSRIEGDYHHKRDVLAGGAVAIFTDWAIDALYKNYKKNNPDLSFSIKTNLKGISIEHEF